jgi:hypothetical protein
LRLRERKHGFEASDADGGNRRFGAPGDHDVHLAPRIHSPASPIACAPLEHALVVQ